MSVVVHVLVVYGLLSVRVGLPITPLVIVMVGVLNVGGAEEPVRGSRVRYVILGSANL